MFCDPQLIRKVQCTFKQLIVLFIRVAFLFSPLPSHTTMLCIKLNMCLLPRDFCQIQGSSDLYLILFLFD